MLSRKQIEAMQLTALQSRYSFYCFACEADNHTACYGELCQCRCTQKEESE
jgi:hypothetical protein